MFDQDLCRQMSSQWQNDLNAPTSYQSVISWGMKQPIITKLYIYTVRSTQYYIYMYIYTCITIHAFHNCPHHNIDNNKTIIPNLTSTHSTHQYLIMETVFLTVTCTVVTCENSIEISFFYLDKHTIIFPKGWSEANFNTNTVFPGTVETFYNTVNFCWSTHKRHSIARPKGRGMGCLLWVQKATYCVDLSKLSSIKYLL